MPLHPALAPLQKEANQLVEEFMLLANMTTARLVADAWPDRCAAPCRAGLCSAHQLPAPSPAALRISSR